MIDRPGNLAELLRLEALVAARPGDLIAAHNLAIEQRRFGRFAEALKGIDGVLRRGLRAPETGIMRAHLLTDLGRFDEAVAQYRFMLTERPDLIEVHEALARLLPQLGQADAALDSYRDALRRIPGQGNLWVSALGSAKMIADHAQLLDWARAAEAQFGPDTMVSTFAVNALSALDRDDEALALVERAVAGEADYAPAQATLAHVALKAGRLDQAEQAALAATRLAPDDQSGWALLTVIWRLREDAREAWLADYERLAMPVWLDGVDLAATANMLTALHDTVAHPADQSLRGGTQTRGNLFDRHDPVIAALRDAIGAAIDGALAGLPIDRTHPFLGRPTGQWRFSGSWSVRLASEGFHISHIHPQGWLSSACYIALPPEIGPDDAGALAFGVPDAALKLDLAPRRVVRPEAGLLVLFPSYFWHGTLPFTSNQPRLTVAFDALPA